MALFHANFFSETLGQWASADVIIPQKAKQQIGNENTSLNNNKTLWLLHGLSDDQTTWQRRSCVEVFAERYGIAVVMPNCDRGWYADAIHGRKYYTYISEELPKIMSSFFYFISEKRENNYIAGNSMGGYGALKTALLNTDKYCAVASFSGALDIGKRIITKDYGDMTDIFGTYDEFKNSDNNLFIAADMAFKSETKPSIYMWCGTEDKLLTESRNFKDYLKSYGFDITYTETAGGHGWPDWNKQLEILLKKWFS